MGVPEGEAKGKGAEKNIQENNIWNFLKPMKSINVHIQKLSKLKIWQTQISTPRHSIVKILKDKEKTLITAREKRFITYKGTSVRLTIDLLSETMEAFRKWMTYSNSSV